MNSPSLLPQPHLSKQSGQSQVLDCLPFTPAFEVQNPLIPTSILPTHTQQVILDGQLPVLVPFRTMTMGTMTAMKQMKTYITRRIARSNAFGERALLRDLFIEAT